MTAREPDPREGLWRILAGTIALAILLSHTIFLFQDGRLPTDMGLTWTHLPALYEALLSGGAWPALHHPGLWLEFVVAVVFQFTAPTATVFGSLDLIWLSAILWGSWWVAKQLAGPRAGLGAIVVIGMLPAVVLQARMSWVHIPETALLIGLVGTLSGANPSRSRTAILTVLGFLALTLRPSALVWIVPVLLLQRWHPPQKRLSRPTLAIWALGTLPTIVGLPTYLDAKLDARVRYTLDVPPLSDQIPDQMGGLGLPVALLGLAFALPWLFRRRRDPMVGELVIWSLLPIALFLGFRAGLENFTPGFAAIAILAGIGLARHTALLGLGMVAWMAFTTLQHSPMPTGAIAQLAEAARLPLAPRLRNSWRPYTTWTADDLAQLVGATCDRRHCAIATDQGLLRPDGEEPGHLERFLLHETPIVLHSLRTPDHDPDKAIAAVIHYDCPTLETSWRRRHPHSLGQYREVVQQHNLLVSWSRRIDPQCVVYWLTPDVRVDHPDRLPIGDPITDRLPVQMPSSSDPLESARIRPGARKP